MQMSVAPVLQLGHVASDKTLPLSFNLLNQPWREQGWRALVAASSRGGKSYTGAVICEELNGLGIPFLVIDPEGEYGSLRALGNVVVVGYDDAGDIRADSNGSWRNVALKLLWEGAGVVLDLSALDEDEWEMEYTHMINDLFFWQVNRKKQRQVEPIFLLIDEAHIFAPEVMEKKDLGWRKATKRVARRGGKYGINTVFMTQRPGELVKAVLGQTNVKFIGRVEIINDYDAVKEYLEPGLRLKDMMKLSAGTFYMRIGGDFHCIKIRERKTNDLGQTPVIQFRQRPQLELTALMAQIGAGR